MSGTTKNENNWHLDKRVPVATIWVLIIQLVGGEAGRGWGCRMEILMRWPSDFPTKVRNVC